MSSKRAADLWVPHPRVTLMGLIPFARHCPRLRALSIVVDARVEAPQHVVSEDEIINWSPSLVELVVSFSAIGSTTEDVELVATIKRLQDVDALRAI